MKTLIVLMMLMSSTFASAADAKKVALVIGNSSYIGARLKNPVNDAKSMAKKLRELGFDVVLKTDASQKDMSRAINEFGAQVKLGSVALFYYAGHGIQVRGKNFLIPVDAEIASEAAVRGESVDLDQVLDQLGSSNSSFVILDACRNNPFESRFQRGNGAGLAQVDAPTGTLLAYATAPGKTAADGFGENGLYTTALLKAMSVPGLKVEDVFKQVRNDVLKESSNAQTPWESSSLTAEFFFIPDNRPVITTEMFKQSESERVQLSKTLEDERQKREKEAESVKVEMEKLRTELQKIRQTAMAAQTIIPMPTPTPKPVVIVSVEAPKPIPVPVVVAKPAPTPEPVKVEVVVAPQPVVVEKPIVIAAVTPEPTSVVTRTAVINPNALKHWTERINLLGAYTEEMTLSKAMAILLDVSSTEDLGLLLVHERRVGHFQWSSAHAVGLNARGEIVWGGAYNEKNTMFASDDALAQCKDRGGDCVLAIVNGDFQKSNFMAFTKKVSNEDADKLRQAFIKTLIRVDHDKVLPYQRAGQCVVESCFVRAYQSPNE